jgi:hypothetical protein
MTELQMNVPRWYNAGWWGLMGEEMAMVGDAEGDRSKGKGKNGA